MDAFYTSVEQRDHPEHRGKPVIVGADPQGGRGRGVVAAASYEARTFGVHSALPISRAYRLCPQGVYLRGNMKNYARVSRRIMDVLESYTDLVEPISIDEAFMDVSVICLPEKGRALAEEVRENVFRHEQVNNHRLEGGGFKGCQLEIDCRREEARHPGSLCTPLPSRPLCFLNSPPDILGPRSAGPKTSSSGEQTPEGVLGSLFLLATARSYSGPGVVGRIRTRGRGRVQPYPRLCAAHVPSRSDESDRAHEPLLDRSKPFYDISVSKRCALLGPFSCALRACSDARDHNTTIFSSPKGEGFRPSPEETLKASIGVASNKFLAKIASDLEKPDGLVVVPEGGELAFLEHLPVERLWGVGPKTAERLHEMGYRKISDLWKVDPGGLPMGKQGDHILKLSRGIDARKVVPHHEARSIGHETTFLEDTDDPEVVRATLLKLAEAVARRLRRHGVRGKTVTLKFRDADFVTETRAHTLIQPTEDAKEIFDVVLAQMERVRGKGKKIRLLGISLSKLEKPGGPRQLSLFGREDKNERLNRAQDSLTERFGKGSVKRASLLD